MYQLIGMTCPNTEKQFKDFNVCDNVGGIYVILATDHYSYKTLQLKMFNPA